MKNPNSLDTLAAALAYAMGIEPPVTAAKANTDLVDFPTVRLYKLSNSELYIA